MLNPWLEYSIVNDSVYCIHCRHFSSSTKTEVFTINGFRAWNRATGKDSKTNAFIKHTKSDDHCFAVDKYKAYKQVLLSGKNVINLMDSNHQKEVLENRHYLKTVAEVLLLTATQNIAQRGHDEGKDSNNKGNFLEALELVSHHDEIIRQRLEDGPRNAKYTHHSIQNAIVSIMAELILKEMQSEVLEGQYYALISDETKDLSHQEQISVVVRYLYNNNIYEEFVGFTAAESVNAESLTEYILQKRTRIGLCITNCIGQSYDGASVMSGHLSGVQTRIKAHAEWCLYTHCYAHRLNLVIVSCCKAVKYSPDFFALLQRIYVFFSGSYVHPLWLQKQREKHSNDKDFKEIEL